jgi:DNA primase
MLLVESPLDVCYIHSLGSVHRYSAVASYGANVSDAQLELIRKSGATSLVLALDNDLAGLEGTRSVLERAAQKHIPTYLFDYGLCLGKDPGEMDWDQIKRGLAEAKLVPARRRRR